ncbi:MAG TPA: 3-isopropylmalate dehydratase large subunit [bacterium]|nr:3-isopropylmalate dehydratase large subunit [bacterium]HOL34271.1 3-isopropylmalate dehydratase large subunit [bacterium]HPP07673.1 3-isopropylmalate dehydratase large subunit [bacterium]
MSMTITEKILAAHSGSKEVFPGQFIEANVDLILANDITGPLAIEQFNKAGANKVFDPGKIVLVPDHFTPCKDIKSAEMVRLLRNFSKRHGVRFYEIGKVGIEHALLPEEGLIHAGDLVIGADSHTCTYGAIGAFSTGVGSTDVAFAMITGKIWLKVPSTIKFIYKGRCGRYVGGKDIILYTIGKIGVDGARYMAMEFTGEAIEDLSMDDRLTICNMAIEAGGKNGIIAPDRITEEFLVSVASEKGIFYKSDKDAKYENIIEIDVGTIEPQVSAPHLPSNAKDVREFSNVRIDQVVIGSCTNGRISDLRKAAMIAKGRTVHPEVRTIIIPATQKVYQQALKEGLIDVFVESGCVISPPTCGPCLGGHMGVLGKGEVAIATTNRNFIGRMGHPESMVYLSNPEVAMASAIMGRISHPDEVKHGY